MEKEKAEKVHSLLNEIECVKEDIETLSKRDCVLCFGVISDCSDKIYASQRDNSGFKNILDRHHRMIIDELKSQTLELEKQIEEL